MRKIVNIFQPSTISSKSTNLWRLTSFYMHLCWSFSIRTPRVPNPREFDTVNYFVLTVLWHKSNNSINISQLPEAKTYSTEGAIWWSLFKRVLCNGCSDKFPKKEHLWWSPFLLILRSCDFTKKHFMKDVFLRVLSSILEQLFYRIPPSDCFR